MKVATHTNDDLGCEAALLPAQDDPTAPVQAVADDVETQGPDDAAESADPMGNVSTSSRCVTHAREWTAARREAVESYLAYLQRVLRLQDWTITVDWAKPTGKDALATMTQMSDSKHATIRLSPEFTTAAPELQGQILVHEMVHCHLFQMESLASTAVSTLAGKRAAAVFDLAYTASNEVATDALADAFHQLAVPFQLP